MKIGVWTDSVDWYLAAPPDVPIESVSISRADLAALLRRALEENAMSQNSESLVQVRVAPHVPPMGAQFQGHEVFLTPFALLWTRPADADALVAAGVAEHVPAVAMKRAGTSAQATEDIAEQRPRQVPSVGRVVHYFAYGTPGGEFPAGVARAAIVTEVYRDPDGNLWADESIGLAVLNPTGLFFNQHVPYGPGQAGHWGWPPYVPPVTAGDVERATTVDAGGFVAT